MSKRTSWREKLADSKDLPRVIRITPGISARWGRGTVVIPAPIDKISTRGKKRFVADFQHKLITFSTSKS